MERIHSVSAEEQGNLRIVEQRLLRMYETLMSEGAREWSLTDAQKERLG